MRMNKGTAKCVKISIPTLMTMSALIWGIDVNPADT